LADTHAYVLGHSERELARLERQAEIFAEPTEDELRRAGIGPGMRVLDIGCGAGDVTLAAARMVGPAGRVVGLDMAPAAIAAARRRASFGGFDNVSFEEADFDRWEHDGRFDAVTGRFILMHLADPAGAVRRLVRRLRPGGIAAFIEMDIHSAAAVPSLPLFERCIAWVSGVYAAAGFEPDMGSKLYSVMRAAGLTPELLGVSKVEAGPNASAYEYLAQSLRSLVPGIVRAGLATEEEVGVDTIADRLRRAAVDGDHCIIFPRLVGAWARTAAEPAQ
jgi:ubiquinone/menaquinone biosynthesis C-methylase UbiE